MVRYGPAQKCCVSVSSGIALLVGIGLTISGAAFSTALARDPATDFSDMGVCKIYSTSVTRKTESSTRTENGRQRTEYTCNDEYVYTFCLPTNLQFCSWKSKTDTKQVCGRRCEECTNTDTTPTFVDGEGTQCWEPAPGKYPPPFPYVCGNTPCYKIFDPAGEATAAIVLGAVLLSIGVVISSISAAIFAWCCCMWKKAEAQQPAATQYASPGGGMQVAAMPVAQAMPVTAAQPVAIAMPVN